MKGISAQGNQLSRQKVNQIDLLEPLPFQAPEAIPADELEVVDEVEISVEAHLQQQKTLEETLPPTEDEEVQQSDDLSSGSTDTEEGQITLF